jgi:hypothetical protein
LSHPLMYGRPPFDGRFGFGPNDLMKRGTIRHFPTGQADPIG